MVNPLFKPSSLARLAAALSLLLTGLLGVTPPARATDGNFVNISTRAVVGTGDEVMIGGFIIQGGPRLVLVQALGPELKNAGIDNALLDPVLTVTNTTNPNNPIQIAVNDNWEDSQGQWITDLWGGNPNLATGSLSSATVLTLNEGNYTAKVEGKNGTAGVALVEVYGIDSTAADGNFVNISTRAMVRTGNDVMIGGFIIQGGPRQVLVQALGPELANAGIDNHLADPVLTVTDVVGTQLMRNDDWEDSQGQLVSDLWGGSPNLARGSLSSAAVLTLQPGNYTAKVEGKNGTTGVAIIEVYAIASPDTPDPDREALMALFDATNGMNWTNSDNWGTDAPLGQWHGVTTDDQGRVTSLNLSENQLSGPIPTEISNLTNLQWLTLFNNQLRGSIPLEFGDLSELRGLNLSTNQLIGEIPTQLSNLANLQFLILNDNQLSGPIPPELGNLTHLERLVLYSNQLTGAIPPELGKLTSLQVLWLSDNQLTGPTPTEIGNLINLEALLLESNLLNGPIPPEIGQLIRLEWLSLDDNQLSGSIPTELGNLIRLEWLSLNDNQLSGPIPPVIGNLTNLETLALHSNQLSGPLPTEIGNLVRLQWLSLDDNQLSGSIPAELGKLTSLEWLSLGVNLLSGPIPPEIGNLTSLQRLDIYNNPLSGSIPLSLADTPLNEFNYFNTELCVPPDSRLRAWLATIDNHLGTGVNCPDTPEADREALITLYHATNGSNWSNSANWLSDAPLDQWHGVTTDDQGRVTQLDLSENQLSGTIPVEIGNMANLEWLLLFKNRLSGTIPPEIGNQTALQFLSLDDNLLSGSIPVELGNLTSLVWLSLSLNNLNGPIPPEIGNLTSLGQLDLYNNPLSGSIPLSLADTPLKEFNYFNTELCLPLSVRLQSWLTTITTHRGTGLECPGTPETDREALIALYHATNGPNWINSTNWLSDASIDQWHGVTTDHQGRVIELNLSENQLSGPIPTAIGNLTSLQFLILHNNRLSGPIPTEIGNLIRLEWLPLDNNQLSGSIPAELGNLTNLLSLSLSSNQLSGPVPTAIGNLTNLRFLILGFNHLSGPIPTEIGNLTDLQILILGDNQLSGSIPPVIGNLTSLERLDIYSNPLSGSMPLSLADTPLNEFYYFSTEICVPPDSRLQAWLTNIGEHLGTGVNCPDTPETDREALIALYHTTNGPNWINNTNWLSNAPLNQWHGVTTDDQGRVLVLDLSENLLSGPIPTEIGNLTNLQSLPLHENLLIGPIPTEIGNLTRLQWLSLDNNLLSGSIPVELGNLTNLLSLSLSSNQLSGPVPNAIGNLTNLHFLILSNNQLSGLIPTGTGNLINLQWLFLGINQLSGPIPTEIGNLTNLQRLRLGLNQLSGPIPTEIGNLTSLEVLDLYSNQLRGPIPLSLANTPLNEFYYFSTEICVPPDSRLQAWLTNIGEHFGTGVECWSNPGTSTVAYLTQATQSLEYPVPLVARESALLRVFVTSPQPTSETIPPVRATFYVNGVQQYVTEIPARSTAIPTVVLEGDPSRSANAEIPASVIRPGLEMVVEIDPGGTVPPTVNLTRRIPAEGRLAVAVQSMPDLNLTLIPFIWTGNNDRAMVDLVEELHPDHDLFWETKYLLPVEGFTVAKHAPVQVDSNDPYDLASETQRIRTAEGGSGHWMGLLRIRDDYPLLGLAKQSGTVSFVDPTRGFEELIVAHELGHNFSLGHAPCGVNDDSLDPNYPHSDGRIGTWGFDSRNDGSLVAPYKPDLMSYCELPIGGPARWISDYNFSKALRYRSTSGAGSGGAFAGEAGVLAATKTLLVSGRVDADGTMRLDPAFVIETLPALPEAPGPYTLTGIAVDGSELFSYAFDMPEIAHGNGELSFAFALPVQASWEQGLASLIFSGPTGEVEIGQGSEPPTLIARDPETGQVRAILKNTSTLPAASPDPSTGVAATPNLEVMVSRGLPEPGAWRP